MVHNDIDYFQANENHIQLLVDFRLLFSDEYVGKQAAEKENELRASLTDYFTSETNKSCFSWFASVDGKPAAVAGLCVRIQPGNYKNPSGKWGYIMGVYTLPEHRRKGFSSGIMERLIRTGHEAGITAFELHATPAGEHVYPKAGFERFHEPTYRLYMK